MQDTNFHERAQLRPTDVLLLARHFNGESIPVPCNRTRNNWISWRLFSPSTGKPLEAAFKFLVCSDSVRSEDERATTFHQWRVAVEFEARQDGYQFDALIQIEELRKKLRRKFGVGHRFKFNGYESSRFNYDDIAECLT